MKANIAAIETAMGRPVTFETIRDRGEATIYACVDDDAGRFTRKVPGPTQEIAVDRLLTIINGGQPCWN